MTKGSHNFDGHRHCGSGKRFFNLSCQDYLTQKPQHIICRSPSCDYSDKFDGDRHCGSGDLPF